MDRFVGAVSSAAVTWVPAVLRRPVRSVHTSNHQSFAVSFREAPALLVWGRKLSDWNSAPAQFSVALMLYVAAAAGSAVPRTMPTEASAAPSTNRRFFFFEVSIPAPILFEVTPKPSHTIGSVPRYIAICKYFSIDRPSHRNISLRGEGVSRRTPAARRGASHPYVGVDDAMGSRQAIGHLINSGRQRIGIISGPMDNVGTRIRFDAAAGCLVDAERSVIFVPATEFSIEAGHAAAETILGEHPDLDALYVASDVLATGVLRYLRAERRVCPRMSQ